MWYWQELVQYIKNNLKNKPFLSFLIVRTDENHIIEIEKPYRFNDLSLTLDYVVYEEGFVRVIVRSSKTSIFPVTTYFLIDTSNLSNSFEQIFRFIELYFNNEI